MNPRPVLVGRYLVTMHAVVPDGIHDTPGVVELLQRRSAIHEDKGPQQQGARHPSWQVGSSHGRGSDSQGAAHPLPRPASGASAADGEKATAEPEQSAIREVVRA